MKEKHNLSEQRRAKKIKDGVDSLRDLLEVSVGLIVPQGVALTRP